MLYRHRGRAVVFNGVDDLHARMDDPVPEWTRTAFSHSAERARWVWTLHARGRTSALPGRLRREGVTDMMRVSDAWVSRTATGTVVLHVSPEAAVGRAPGYVRDGDMSEVNVDTSRLYLLVDPEELTRRPSSALPLEPPTRGYEALHRAHVLQANQGCDFDFLLARPAFAGLG